MISPGGKIGIFGGGQLGRMSAIAARELGYGIQIFEPGEDCPAGHIADAVTRADYLNLAEVRKFAQSVDVLTYEFENIPVAALEAAAESRQIFPSPLVLNICQHREREKTFLRDSGIPCADFRVVSSFEELESAAALIGFPSVLKTAAFGYDGKGQRKLTSPADLESAWKALGGDRMVLEAWVNFQVELSVVCARSADGTTRCFPASENIHTNHILSLSIVPARVASEVVQNAELLATHIADRLQVVGLIAVEFFVRPDGTLLVNEMAPRPHNSGHYTLDACVTSQFEQHVRAVCGLPLGAPDLLQPAVMLNVLGDVWHSGQPAWQKILQLPRSKVHLYGKQEARPGRKMGHITFLGENALSHAEETKNILAHL